MGELIYWPINQQAISEIEAFNKMPGNCFPGILGVIGMVDLKKTCTANPSKHTKDGSSIAIQVRLIIYASINLILEKYSKIVQW